MAEQWRRRRQILMALNQAETFISGETLAHQLDVSRATISNHIDALEHAGVGVYSVKGKGYKLEKPVPLINGQQLLDGIDSRCFYFDEIDSTNSFVLKHAEELKSGDICIAEAPNVWSRASRTQVGITLWQSSLCIDAVAVSSRYGSSNGVKFSCRVFISESLKQPWSH